jgi:hypothetical protein
VNGVVAHPEGGLQGGKDSRKQQTDPRGHVDHDEGAREDLVSVGTVGQICEEGIPCGHGRPLGDPQDPAYREEIPKVRGQRKREKRSCARQSAEGQDMLPAINVRGDSKRDGGENHGDSLGRDEGPGLQGSEADCHEPCPQSDLEEADGEKERDKGKNQDRDGSGILGSSLYSQGLLAC